jgi:DNA repair exonuclease SbcCD ATPase subunit
MNKNILKISLTNFKAHDSFVAECFGNTLLSGRSGAGKTSILDAIFFAITGKGKHIRRDDTKPVKVNLELNTQSGKNIKISRCKYPAELSFIYDFTKPALNGSVAQTEIDNLFGSNFETVNYIMQDTVKTFVNMTNTERFTFLESIVASQNSNGDPMILSERIKSEIQKCSDQIQSISARLSVYNSESGISIESDKYPKKYSTKYKRTLSTNITKCDMAIEKINKLIDEHVIYSTNNSELLRLQEQYTDENTTLVDLVFQLNSYTVPSNSVEELNFEMQNTHRTLSSVTTCSESINLAGSSTVVEEINPIEVSLLPKLKIINESYVNLHQEFGDFCTDVQLTIPEVNLLIDSVDTTIRSLGTKAECPGCGVNLLVSPDGTLSLNCDSSTFGTKNDLVQAKNKKKKLENFLTRLQILSDNLLELFNQTVSFEPVVIYQSILNLENYNAEYITKYIKKMEKKILDIDKIKRSNEAKAANVASLNQQLSSLLSEANFTCPEKFVLYLQDKIKRITSEIEVSNCILRVRKSIIKQEAKIREIARKIDSYTTGNSIACPPSNLNTLRAKLSEYKLKADTYGKLLKNVLHVDSLHHKCMIINVENTNLNLYTTRMNGMNELKGLIKQAQLVMMEEIVQQINVTASIYLESFFPDEPIEVTLIQCKNTLQFVVNYKRLTEVSLDLLSGGERDRVALAFTLALADTIFAGKTDYKIMLLDECVSSLDQTTSQYVMDALQDRLVISVAHQISTGAFDTVLQV